MLRRQMNHRCEKAVFIVCVTCMCVLFPLVPKVVWGNSDSPQGSITLKAVITQEEGSTFGLADTEFTLYQVGEVKNPGWGLTPAFQEAQVKFDFQDATKQNSEADVLNQFALLHHVTGLTQKTNIQGECSFTNLPMGVYLLAQQQMTVHGKDQYQSIPFIVSIPTQIQGKNVYQVVVEPKFKNESLEEPNLPPKKEQPPKEEQPPKPANPSTPTKVKTGDPSPIGFWVLWGGGSLGIFGMLVLTRKKQNNKKTTSAGL